MTAKEIFEKIEKNLDCHNIVFGIRSDDKIYGPGDELPCSENMNDDLYDYERHCYPMLDGTCATGFGCLWMDSEKEDEKEINRIINFNKEMYKRNHQYLIAGTGYKYGDDKEEIVIKNAVVICKI